MGSKAIVRSNAWSLYGVEAPKDAITRDALSDEGETRS